MLFTNCGLLFLDNRLPHKYSDSALGLIASILQKPVAYIGIKSGRYLFSLLRHKPSLAHRGQKKSRTCARKSALRKSPFTRRLYEGSRAANMIGLNWLHTQAPKGRKREREEEEG